MAKRHYCEIEDFKRDALLGEDVTEEDILATTDYIDDLAWQIGVDPSNIPNVNVPYKVKQLAIYYTFMNMAQDSSRMNNKAQDGADAYEFKRRVYASKVDALVEQMTPRVLLGNNFHDSAFPVITIGRA